MKAVDRREMVLQAATRAFARGGYAGTSTDTVASEAGVSQPYVVRIFGTKLELFLEVLGHAAAQISATFAKVLATEPVDPDQDTAWDRLGEAYADLMADRHLLQVQLQGFAAGDVPEIAEASRRGMATVFATIKRTGWDDDHCRDFIARGMLLNVLLAMHAPEHLTEDDDLATLTLRACENLPQPD